MGEDNIPLEVQQEIIKRIDDVKTLLRCTSVSKPWNSFIKTPEFVADYHIQRQRHHLLVESLENHVSFVVDDDTFPQNKFSLPCPDRVEPFTIQGSSLGLICFVRDNNANGYGYGIHYDDANDDVDKLIAVVWNPFIRKSIMVNYRVPPSYFSKNYCDTFGFGVSPHTNDPMLVKIPDSRFLHVDNDDDNDYMDLFLDSIPSLPVEVYTLSSRVWTTLSISLPRKTIGFGSGQVVIDEFIYWIAYDKTLHRNTFLKNRRLILSFDMKSQEFIEICLPKKLAGGGPGSSAFYLSKLRESLVVVESNSDHNYIVWKMECGVPNSFAKLYDIKIPNASNFIQLRFKKSGGHIVLAGRGASEGEDLFVYEPDSKHTYKFGIHGTLIYIDTYMETLLLLNQ